MKNYTLSIYIALVTLLLAACSTDDIENGEYGNMTTITLNMTTRATGTPEGPEYDIEKIHTWWVAFVDKNGKVQKVVTRPSVKTDYVEEEKVEVDVPTGTYTLYAFANLSQTDLQTAGFTFTEGSPYPSAIESATWTLASPWTSGDIPMTGKQTVTVTGRANETFSIEVVRMLAKMEFLFSNESVSEITVNKLTMTQAPTDLVPLLPNYDYLDSGWPITADGTSRPLVRTYTTGNKLAGYAASPAASFKDRFYMIESQANYNFARRYMFNVNVTRTGSGHTDDYLFALTKNLESIYRNDHIVIPIVLSDYMVDLEVNFYPPIGGYPAVITTDSKEQFFCEFATQGEFAVRPHVVDASNGYSLVYKEGGFSTSPCYNYVIKEISDPSKIFVGTPAIESTSGEILGRLNTTEGTAYIDVEITVKRTSGADQIYDRRIYIIRKNA